MKYNMIFLYTTSQQAYALARLPEGKTVDTFLAENKYTYSYTNSAGGVTNNSIYKIPNTWIIDALNTSREGDFLQILTTASIDSGWTTTSTGYNGKTVRRKVLGLMSNGKNLYKDTNNSTVDFIRNSEPSLKNGIIK